MDPQLRFDLRVVAAHLLDEPLRVLAADEHLNRIAEREVWREGVVDDGVDDHDEIVGCSGETRHASHPLVRANPEYWQPLELEVYDA